MNQINSGTIINLQISTQKGDPVSRVPELEFIKGLGISGESHAGKSENRQVLLMDSETQKLFDITPDITRENVTTKNLQLSKLSPGDMLALGNSVRLEVTGDCEPCKSLDIKKPGLSEAIKGHRGILAKVIDSGFVKLNDTIGME
ncbi:MAG: hypothetical protein CL904_05620 [Dehalococcoidia bacterium]|nr:hypothetical protein [Dehalococcoidia bacterium]MQG15312.1 hypothetical protein [SAR202 cluster bacterium]|tara:strand:+ start:283 stop:717 length:435 start_codon:yes stop_codon:yes gene_type:complete